MTAMARLLLALLLALTAASGQATEAQPLNVAGVPNLHQVSPVLFRSAMPDAEGFVSIEDTPIRSILSLRWNADPEDATPDDGPLRLHMPIRTWDLEEEHVVEFLKLVTDPANQPMLVHCKHGADRTGTMVAAYRIVVQGWSKNAALAEMKSDEYGHHWIWVNLRRFVRDMDVERIRAAAGLPMATTAAP